MDSWQEYFPLEECRPSQAKALDFIVESFAEYDDIFIEAPTDVGKSAIAIAVARWLAAQEHRSFIATATVSLEDQYVTDFHKHGLRQLHSKSWYTCPQCGTLAKSRDQPRSKLLERSENGVRKKHVFMLVQKLGFLDRICRSRIMLSC